MAYRRKSLSLSAGFISRTEDRYKVAIREHKTRGDSMFLYTARQHHIAWENYQQNQSLVLLQPTKTSRSDVRPPVQVARVKPPSWLQLQQKKTVVQEQIKVHYEGGAHTKSKPRKKSTNTGPSASSTVRNNKVSPSRRHPASTLTDEACIVYLCLTFRHHHHRHRHRQRSLRA